MLPELLAVAAKIREEIWKDQKKEHEISAQEFFKDSKFTDQDRAWMLDTIKKRMMGKVDDKEWAGFMEVLDRVVPDDGPSGYACDHCKDSGFVLKTGPNEVVPTAWRCGNCSAADAAGLSRKMPETSARPASPPAVQR